jgi:menaquinol-cytochrome c reductase iron-sulfur subunit
MTEPTEPLPPTRRSLLGFAIVGIGAIFSAIIGFPIVCYVIDPRHRKGPKSAMKLVDGVKLDDPNLLAGKPVQGVVRDTRTDGWTLYPNDVIGRVWVVQLGPAPPNPLAMDAAAKAAYLKVFSTICPHLGCSVNLGGPAFLCPCHAAAFTITGAQSGAGNPAKRGMDELAWEIDEADPTRINVEYKNFKSLEATKIPLG